MITIDVLNNKKIIFSQKINHLNPQTIQSCLGDNIIIKNLENHKIVTYKAGNDLLFFCNYDKKPLIVLANYFQEHTPPTLQMTVERKTLFYQPTTLTWTSGEQVTRKKPLQTVSGGRGASAGIPPLVWGFGVLANLEGITVLSNERPPKYKLTSPAIHHFGSYKKPKKSALRFIG